MQCYAIQLSSRLSVRLSGTSVFIVNSAWMKIVLRVQYRSLKYELVYATVNYITTKSPVVQLGQGYCHIMFTIHINPIPIINFVFTPGFHSVWLYHKLSPREEEDWPSSARRSTQRLTGRIGVSGSGGNVSSPPFCSTSSRETKGIASWWVLRDVEDEGPSRTALVGILTVGNDFFSTLHIQAVITPVACATRWET